MTKGQTITYNIYLSKKKTFVQISSKPPQTPESKSISLDLDIWFQGYIIDVVITQEMLQKSFLYHDK